MLDQLVVVRGRTIRLHWTLLNILGAAVANAICQIHCYLHYLTPLLPMPPLPEQKNFHVLDNNEYVYDISR